MNTNIKYHFRIVLFGSLVLFFINSSASIRNVPASYTTIQSALNSCLNDDTVLVAPRVYYEHIVWPNIPNVKLLSSGDSTNTTIDGSNNGVPISFYQFPDYTGNNTIVDGFSVRNGFGGGIRISYCSPLLRNLCIHDNHLSVPNGFAGGAGLRISYSNTLVENSQIIYNTIDSSDWAEGNGVYCYSSSTIFNNCKVNYNKSKANASWYYGGGMEIENGSVNITNAEFSYNTMGDNGSWYGGGGISLYNCSANLVNVKVHGNKLGNNGSWYFSSGMYIIGSNANLTNLLVDSNVNGTGGGWYFGLGIYIDRYVSWYPANTINLVHATVTNNINVTSNYISGKSIYNDCNGNDCDSLTIKVKNSILYNNSYGDEIYTNSLTSVTYSDVKRYSGVYAGAGNINQNPNFISVNNPHLNSTSPCSNTGVIISYPTFDLDNTSRPFPIASNPDMGCYENGLIYTYLNLVHTLCQGDTFMNHFVSGIYIDTINTLTGFDTIRTLNLTVLPNSSSNITQTICQGNSYLGYTSTGIYNDTLVSSNGCDSIRTLNLTVLPNSSANITQTICQGNSYLGYSSEGIYIDTLISNNGCDSIRTLNLTVLPNSSSNIIQTICQGNSYLGYTLSGTFIDTLVSSNGCDSIRTLNLNVITNYHDTIHHQLCPGESYFSYNQSGIYIDTFINSFGCDSIRILKLELDEHLCCQIFAPNAFTPNRDNLNDEFLIKGAFDEYNILIADRWGNIVYKSSNSFFGWDGMYKGAEMPIGTYYYIFKYKCNNSELKTIKGDITLIR